MTNLYEITDEEGQSKVIPILKKLFEKYNPIFEQHYKDKGRIDIFMYLGNVRYAIECKDRKFEHFKYPSIMIEPHKYQALKSIIDSKTKSIYFNTFADDTFVVWDMSKVSYTEKEVYSPISTVENKGKKMQLKYFIPFEDAVYKGRVSDIVDSNPL